MAQSVLRGKSEHNLDAKGRLNIPSRYQDVLREKGAEAFLVVPWFDHLRAYLPEKWDEEEAKLLEQGPTLANHKSFNDWLRNVIGSVVECVPDKQGRILIPPELRAEAGLTKEVMLLGIRDYFEIWDKQLLLSNQVKSREDEDEHKKVVNQLGILA
jgi:MraZ protein